MLNKNAEKWVKALRSGDYQQGFCSLKDGDKYCCLGVATCVYRNEHPNSPIELLEGTRMKMDVMEWFGLIDGLGMFSDKFNSLACLNDDYKYTFSEIADIIESEPKGLFHEQQC